VGFCELLIWDVFLFFRGTENTATELQKLLLRQFPWIYPVKQRSVPRLKDPVSHNVVVLTGKEIHSGDIIRIFHENLFVIFVSQLMVCFKNIFTQTYQLSLKPVLTNPSVFNTKASVMP
jgi:hypothetical protein